MSGPNGRKEHFWCSTARFADIRGPVWIFVGLGHRPLSDAFVAGTVWFVCQSASPCASREACPGSLVHPAAPLLGLPNIRRRGCRVAGRVHLCYAAFPQSQQRPLLPPSRGRAITMPRQRCRCWRRGLQWLQRRQHRRRAARAPAWALRITRLSRQHGAAVSTRRISICAKTAANRF